MSGLSEKLYWCKRCAYCLEEMPLTEVRCYCGGPIKLFRSSNKKKIDGYLTRKLLKGSK